MPKSIKESGRVGGWVARGRGECIGGWVARGRGKCVGGWVARGRGELTGKSESLDGV